MLKLSSTLHVFYPKAIHAWKNNQSQCQSLSCYYLSHDHNLELVGIFKRPSGRTIVCSARRRVRYDVEEDDEGEDSSYNEEIAMLEMYSQLAREEALLVTAMVDDQEVEVLIFKGFSSCLSYKTSPDPSKSILPQRAKIKVVNRIKGPFNPANVEYIEKDLAWETFRNRLTSN